MKLTTTTMVTVDGVMQGLGGPDEDRSGGFERGGWVTHSFDNEAMAFLNQVYQRADAFLFGRRTYEILGLPPIHGRLGQPQLGRDPPHRPPGSNQLQHPAAELRIVGSWHASSSASGRTSLT